MGDNLQLRPPVVVILGHVDHGKSSILQTIKDFKITEKESGGITQHIGAYEVEHQDKKITFIDTPGHEAFGAMRSRGSKVADIAILVIAADDGVRPQTKEAIKHIKKAGLSVIVAINKIDRQQANPAKVKEELAKEDILVEGMGGKIPCVETSAKTGKGIVELLELILLIAEMEKLKGDFQKRGEGVVIEAYLDSLRGPTATLLLREGILKKDDIIATSSALGKVKVLENFQGKVLEKASPSMPAVILGFEKVPQVGEKFKVYPDIESAKKSIYAKSKKREIKAEVFLAEPGKKVLNLILKSDVSGSLEAVEEILKNIPQENVVLRVLKTAVGEINENDIKLAKGAKAYIFGFRVKVSQAAKKIAEREKIKLVTFDVIYELTQNVRQIMERFLKPEIVREDLGKVKALIIFHTEKNRQVVGGKIIDGEVKKGTSVEVYRREEKVGKGRVVNLQRNKKNMERLTTGDECGILYEGDAKVEEGDILEIYTEKREKREL